MNHFFILVSSPLSSDFSQSFTSINVGIDRDSIVRTHASRMPWPPCYCILKRIPTNPFIFIYISENWFLEHFWLDRFPAVKVLVKSILQSLFLILNLEPQSGINSFSVLLHSEESIGFYLFIIHVGDLVSMMDTLVVFLSQFSSQGSWKLTIIE